MTTGAEAAERADDVWYDRIVERDENWITYEVTNSRGQRRLWRVMITPLPEDV